MADGPSTSDKASGLSISLPARAANVAVVRHALAGLAEEIGMDAAGIADLKTVVTEACMNVVVHAYGGEPGPLYIEATPDSEGLEILIRDSGSGIRPRADVDQPSLRLGLSLIAALSSSFSISGGLERGTEIQVRLPLTGGGAREGGPPAPVETSTDATEIVVGSAELLSPILARVVGALAARRELALDQISDALLLTDAIADAAPGRFRNGEVRLALADREKGLELRLGPMEDGGAERIRAELSVPDVGGTLEALADEFAVEDGEDGDYVAIRFSSPAPAP
jgi:anti-sigma regulatory factor (Ser/Thr protein kinase)